MRAAILALALVAAPASSRTLDQRLHDLPAEEWVFQGVNAADAATTIYNLHRGYDEMNPILGHHPSDAAVIGHIAAVGVLHAIGTSILQDHAPKAVKAWEWASISVKAGAVAWNIHFHF